MNCSESKFVTRGLLAALSHFIVNAQARSDVFLCAFTHIPQSKSVSFKTLNIFKVYSKKIIQDVQSIVRNL